MTPRCGRVMRRYETVWVARRAAPICGRPEGHNGPCRSAAAVARYLRADVDRQAAARERSRAA